MEIRGLGAARHIHETYTYHDNAICFTSACAHVQVTSLFTKHIFTQYGSYDANKCPLGVSVLINTDLPIYCDFGLGN